MSQVAQVGFARAPQSGPEDHSASRQASITHTVPIYLPPRSLAPRQRSDGPPHRLPRSAMLLVKCSLDWTGDWMRNHLLLPACYLLLAGRGTNCDCLFVYRIQEAVRANSFIFFLRLYIRFTAVLVF